MCGALVLELYLVCGDMICPYGSIRLAHSAVSERGGFARGARSCYSSRARDVAHGQESTANTHDAALGASSDDGGADGGDAAARDADAPSARRGASPRRLVLAGRLHFKYAADCWPAQPAFYGCNNSWGDLDCEADFSKIRLRTRTCSNSLSCSTARGSSNGLGGESSIQPTLRTVQDGRCST